MKTRFHKLPVLVISLAYAVQAVAGVVLSEIMFDPEGAESSDEFVEAFNDAALPVQLSGWTISDGQGLDTLISIGQGLTLAPRHFVLILDPDYIADGSITYDGIVPEDALVVTITSNTFGSRGLSNSSGELITLRSATGAIVSEYRYTIGNASGHSDEKIRLNQSNDSTNWSNSISLLGTPGFRNSVTPPEHDLGIIGIDFYPEFPAVSSRFQFEILIKNFGLHPLSSTITVRADSLGHGQYYSILTSELSAISPGDCTSVVDSLVMPVSGFQQMLAELNLADDDSSNNHVTTLISSEVHETGLRLNELQFSPLSGRAEWLELVVAGTMPLSVRGFLISDGQGLVDSTERTQLPDFVIQAGEFVVVATDSAVFLENIPSESHVIVLGTSGITLNNSGDSIAIFSSSGEILDRIDYRPNWGNNDVGVSLERISLNVPTNFETNWGASVDPQGSTPGRANSLSILKPRPESSISVSPSPFTPNGDGIDEVTEIQFTAENMAGTTTIVIFDSRGRVARRLATAYQGGTGSVLWDGRRDNGQLSATGRYIVLLESEESNGNSQGRATVVLARPK